MIIKRKVSICCITYNHGSYIEKTLEGFLNQDVDFDFEILIHDDASTDKTVEVIKKFEKKYPNLIKPIYSNVNIYSQGESAIKKLLSIASGDYIAFCEGDDFWIDDKKLNKQINFLDSNKEYVASYHNVRVVDEVGNYFIEEQDSFPLYETHEIYEHEVEVGILCGQLASLVCRNIWKNWSKDKLDQFFNFNLNDDIKISSLMVNEGKVKFMSDIMACYRRTYTGDSWNARTYNKNQTMHLINANRELDKLYKNMFGLNRNDYSVNVIIYSFKFFIKRPSVQNWVCLITSIKQSKSKIRSIIEFLLRILKFILPKDNSRNSRWPRLKNTGL